VAADPRDENERFRARYAVSGAETLLAVEAEALGSDFQANGYTTMGQADELGRVLDLGPGQVLLDVGAGCGWPGVHLAATHGCAVISVDPIAEGVGVARRRGITDGMGERSWAIRANADPLPVRPGSVDAVVHADLLC
jgi:hypothetical protein